MAGSRLGVLPAPVADPGRTRHHKFNVVANNFTRLCSAKSIITVNGRFPGPTLYAREGDTVIVKVANHVQENVTIHWHGIRQLTTGWADGPAYVTQCPIQPGQNYAYNFTSRASAARCCGTPTSCGRELRSMAPSSSSPNAAFPIPSPRLTKKSSSSWTLICRLNLISAEWWKSDVEAVINEALQSGLAPNVSDAHTINGHAGPVSGCASSARDGFTLLVDQGKTYLLRIINAALNDDLFFKVAGHLMTVVEVDATYTKHFTIDTLLIAPGQTTNVLLTADQGAGRYLVTASPFMDSPLVAVDNSTGTATVQYTNAVPTSAIATTKPPPRNSTSLASQFIDSLRSLNSKQYPASVPSTVDHSLLFTVGLGVNPCPACTNGSRVVAAMNNVTFMMPTTALLQAHYFNTSGVFTTDFPGQPLIAFNYTGSGPNNTQTMNGTRLYRLPYNASVQLVLQDTGIIGPESHPIHLHGYNFFVVGRGVGNYDPATSPSKFNLVDPVERNTVAVPSAGWTAIRFRADNPGVWFLHCHFEVHTTWGLKMAFVVDDGPGPNQIVWTGPPSAKYIFLALRPALPPFRLHRRDHRVLRSSLPAPLRRRLPQSPLLRRRPPRGSSSLLSFFLVLFTLNFRMHRGFLLDNGNYLLAELKKNILPVEVDGPCGWISASCCFQYHENILIYTPA
ncbi:Multicopper oxidase [Musa troglodytarum]|uniref:Laccase n=1 Tax=Musa troglodytarum TaxID=320322 RepID=A0A9E7EUT9_9LILI|nr:Multicopper oxidase [Musa troglodytarum]